MAMPNRTIRRDGKYITVDENGNIIDIGEGNLSPIKPLLDRLQVLPGDTVRGLEVIGSDIKNLYDDLMPNLIYSDKVDEKGRPLTEAQAGQTRTKKSREERVGPILDRGSQFLKSQLEQSSAPAKTTKTPKKTIVPPGQRPLEEIKKSYEEAYSKYDSPVPERESFTYDQLGTDVVDPDAIAAEQLKQLGLLMQQGGVRDAAMGQLPPGARLGGGGSGELPDNPAAAIKNYLESAGGKEFMGGVTLDNVQNMQQPDSGTDVGTPALPVMSPEDARKFFLTGTTSLDGLKAMEKELGLTYGGGSYYLNVGGSPLKVKNELARAYKRGDLSLDELRNDPMGEITSPARAQQPNFSRSMLEKPVSEQTNPGIAFDPAFDNFNRANQTPFETNFAELSEQLRDMGSNFTPYFSDPSKFYGY